MVPRHVKLLVLFHGSISLTGVVAHAVIHPPATSLYFWWASPFSIVSLLILPPLFLRPQTVAWGYLFNAYAVAIGVIGMTYFSLLTMERPLTMTAILLDSTLPATALLLLKLPLASGILRRMRRSDAAAQPGTTP